MATTGVVGTPAAPAYDPKLTLKAAGKAALIAALSIIVADQMGLTAYIVANLPEQYKLLGYALVVAVFAAARNYIANRNR